MKEIHLTAPKRLQRHTFTPESLGKFVQLAPKLCKNIEVILMEGFALSETNQVLLSHHQLQKVLGEVVFVANGYPQIDLSTIEAQLESWLKWSLYL